MVRIDHLSGNVKNSKTGSASDIGNALSKKVYHVGLSEAELDNKKISAFPQ